MSEEPNDEADNSWHVFSLQSYMKEQADKLLKSNVASVTDLLMNRMNKEKPMKEKINQMMVVFTPTGEPPKMGEFLSLNDDRTYTKRSLSNDSLYTPFDGFHRIEIPMPGKHTNEAGELVAVRRAKLTPNGWDIELPDAVWTLEQFNSWKAKKPKRKVTRTIERFVVVFSNGTQIDFIKRNSAEATAKENPGSMVVPVSGTYEVEEEVQ